MLKLYRTFYWDGKSSNSLFNSGSPLYVNKAYQGTGRFDLDDEGVIYCSLEAISSVAEILSPYRNSKIFQRTFKNKQGYHISLAEIEMKDDINLIDFRDAHQIIEMKTTPSNIATFDREVTQKLARLIKDKGLDGLLWWSVLEALWSNSAIFESNIKKFKNIKINNITKLTIDNVIVENAAEFLNIQIAK